MVRANGSLAQVQPCTMPVPEPGAYAMFLAGLGLVGFMARRLTAPCRPAGADSPTFA